MSSKFWVFSIAPRVDHVFPALPVRQWVLSLPKRLRYNLDDAKRQNAVLHSFLPAIEQGLRQPLPDGDGTARIGAVVFIYRFGELMNAHLHFHAVVIDGGFWGRMPGACVLGRRTSPQERWRDCNRLSVSGPSVSSSSAACSTRPRAKPYRAASTAAASRSTPACVSKARTGRACQPDPDTPRTAGPPRRADPAAPAPPASLLRCAGAECAAAPGGHGTGGGAEATLG